MVILVICLCLKTGSNNIKAKRLIERELLSLNLSAHLLDFYHFDNGHTRIEGLQSNDLLAIAFRLAN